MELTLRHNGKLLFSALISADRLGRRLGELAAELNTTRNTVALVALEMGVKSLRVTIADRKGGFESQSLRAELALDELGAQEQLEKATARLSATLRGKTIAHKYGVELE